MIPRGLPAPQPLKSPKPLSDDEIGIIHDSISEKLLKGDIDTNEFDWQFARAIEQAHGIK